MTDSFCCEGALDEILPRIISSINAKDALSEVAPDEIERLADRFVDHIESPRDLESALRALFALNGSGAALFFAGIRRRAPQTKGSDTFRAAETEIAGLVESLNGFAQEKTGMPYHLAAASGRRVIDADFERRYRPLRDRLFGGQMDPDPKAPAGRAAAALPCPTASFPRYVNSVLPWNLSASFSTRSYQRPEDVGCHFRHGPFGGTIRGWTTFSAVVATMIVLQGWGGSLAADNNNLFYKWWALAVLSLTPYDVQLKLFTRRF